MKTMFAILSVAIVGSVAAGRLNAEIRPIHVARGAYPDVTVDADGGVHLVYCRNGTLRYRYLARAETRRSDEEDTGLKAGRVERSDPEVVVDSKRQPHALVGASYAWRDAAGWHAIDPGATRDTALAIDSKDNVFLVRRGGHAGGHVGLRVRAAGSNRFEPLPDPDIASQLPIGRNDHVYAHLVIDPRDNALHVVFRHGAPQACAYRVSRDGGKSWEGSGVSNDDREAPSLAVTPAGAVVVVTGTGQIFQRMETEGQWKPLGRAIQGQSRDLPIVVADATSRLYVASFGGRLNVSANGKFAEERRLPALRGKALGFVDLAASPDGRAVYAAWEEGDAVNNDAPAGESDILFARIDVK